MMNAPPEAPEAQLDTKQRNTGRLPSALAIVANIVTAVAGLVAIAGIWVWIDEAGDRAEERAARVEERNAREEERQARSSEAEVRRASTIGLALEFLDRDMARGIVSTADSLPTRWAVETLAALEVPMIIKAPSVDLSYVKLECADIVVEAEAFLMERATVARSRFELVGGEPNIAETWISNVTLALKSNGEADGPALTIYDSDVVALKLFDTANEDAPYYARTLLDSEIVFRNSRVLRSEIWQASGTYSLDALGADIEHYVLSQRCQPGRGGEYGECRPLGDPEVDVRVDSPPQGFDQRACLGPLRVVEF